MTTPAVQSENRTIFSYALLKAFAEANSDSLEAFIPFVLKALSVDTYQSVPQLKDAAKLNSGLEIPHHAVQLMLNKLVNRKWVEKKNNVNKYQLTNLGQENNISFKVQQDITRELNSLVDDLHEFMEQKGEVFNKDEVNQMLLAFTLENTEPLLEYIIPHRTIHDQNDRRWRENKNSPLDAYIQQILERKPNHYKTLKQVVLGSVLSCLMRTRSREEIEAISNLASCILYLDTNYLLSLLELHDKEFSTPAKELLELIKLYEFKPKILSSTLIELTTVLKGFEDVYQNYPSNLRIDSIYSVMIRKGFTKSFLNLYIADLESKLNDMGIEIEQVNIDIDRFVPENPSFLDSIQKYKLYQGNANRNHDVAAIEFVKKKRGREFYKFTEVPYFFLTSDRGLYEFDSKEVGHERRGTISNVMLDRALTGLLWLKNPKVDISLEAIIAAHTQYALINDRIWERFLELLKELKSRGKVKQSDIDNVIYCGSLNESLGEVTEQAIDRVNETFVLGHIAKAGKFRKAEVDNAAKEASDLMQDDLTAKFNGVLEKQDNEHKEQVKQVRDDADAKSETEQRKIIETLSLGRARAWINFLRVFTVFVTLGGISLCWYTGLIPDMNNVLKTMTTIFAFAITVSGIKIDKLWPGLEKFLTERFIRSNQKQIDLKV